VFGGWDFGADEVSRPDFVKQGYARGVPMGGDLSNAPEGAAPTFMVRALRDPDGANLDRVQVIKGWLDANGDLHERIYDVAVSDGRVIGDDGRARDTVGSTVDLDNATYTNTIGDAVLAGHWQDPHFDPAESAFYYVRVLEIPTPRWTTYDAAFFGIKRPDNVPATVQDRAYTSPIWYTP
jgi:GT2 family glycosyltransferase